MPTEKKDRNTIVSRAIGIASEEERAAYIAEACGDDDEKRRQVEERVAEHFHSGEEDSDSDADGDADSAQERSQPEEKSHANGRESPLTHIGPYKIVKHMGEGPTGTVYQAEQQDPVSLKVAVKVIKKGLNWQQIATRLEAERQILARMDHPGLARLLGAGTRPSGQPYIVMELVEGLPLTRYCDEHHLSLRRRLELFISVCEAVQHAHQKGVLHGDLKPSNVLVSHQEDKPAPRILDLGLAGVMRRKPGDRPSAGDAERFNGKPEYLSPEQAGGDDSDIDTRSDVYSLGVLLYELVAGTTPLTPEQLKDVSRTETLRLVREEEAPPPSSRLNDSKARLSSLAEKRQMKPDDLVKATQGELDCIVMKALKKDRAERYQTVQELARDLQRHLADEPVEACPPSTKDRLRKWAKKHPTQLAGVVAGLLLLLTLALGGAGLGAWEWWKAGKARKAEQAAVKKEKEKEEEEKKLKSKLHDSEEVRKIREKERDRAREREKEAQNAESQTKRILDFFKKQLMSAGRPAEVSLERAFWAGAGGVQDPTVRKNITLREAVDETEAKVAPTFADQPLAEATVREMLGLAYRNLGVADKSVEQYKRAFELRKAHQGASSSDTARCRNELAVALRNAGRDPEAARLFDHAPKSASEADALSVRGAMLLLEKKPTEAELKLRESLNIREEVQSDDWTTFETKSLLGEALLQQKKYNEAEPLLLSGYQGMKKHESKIPARERVRLRKALERLVHLYEVWNKPDRADKWRKELDAIAPDKP